MNVSVSSSHVSSSSSQGSSVSPSSSLSSITSSSPPSNKSSEGLRVFPSRSNSSPNSVRRLIAKISLSSTPDVQEAAAPVLKLSSSSAPQLSQTIDYQDVISDARKYFEEVKGRFSSVTSRETVEVLVKQYLKAKNERSSVKNICTAVAFFIFNVPERFYGCFYPLGKLFDSFVMPIVYDPQSLYIAPDQVTRSVNMDGTFIPTSIKIGTEIIHSKEFSQNIALDKMTTFYQDFVKKVLALIPQSKKGEWLRIPGYSKDVVKGYFEYPEGIGKYLQQFPVLRVLPFFSVNSAARAKMVLSEIIQPLREYREEDRVLCTRSNPEIGQNFWIFWSSDKNALCCRRTSSDTVYVRQGGTDRPIAEILSTFTLYLPTKHAEEYDAELTIDSCNFLESAMLDDALLFFQAVSGCEEKILQLGQKKQIVV